MVIFKLPYPPFLLSNLLILVALFADFTFIHSKFIAPLPPTLFEFMCSLRLVFTNIIDINHLSKEIGPLRKAKNLPAALSYLKRQFFVPIDIELPPKGIVLLAGVFFLPSHQIILYIFVILHKQQKFMDYLFFLVRLIPSPISCYKLESPSVTLLLTSNYF